MTYLDVAAATVPATSAVQNPERNEDADDEELHDSLSEFDSGSFLEAMQTQDRFHPVSDDDNNLCPEDLDCGYGLEEASSEGSDEGMEVQESMCYADDVDSSDSGDASADITFDVPDDSLRNIAAAGWEIYDEQHSGKKLPCI
ncbi:hypothetical protein PF005_g12521 [Phytophthora fragariae]|nr:hypothetical protein PF003_g39421 [Phytophthora fragariae]KAE8938211.1 hypothetical protein PF009_g11891 [Phytophthora fragariae]KAE9003959.1 hypothetical protein PF011_g12660 [Phytophthora fragariae]KAE9097147.1 hypothetical protein PF010_g16070 [Phytophthora fragariae]KAE9111953.1 hypothetical protein PF007_g11277 [Phytophthora fragariae]